ncbi:MAG TPA: RagB/SusD family nutrient uptake outer membrane protein [Draconibacterium sp.]|nr:RagB/SusD family nutrient uptake outer membrane protein [Draconibacterium sp.]
MNNMKKLSIIMVMMLLLTISFSCSEEFLTKEPMGVTSENVFYDAKGIEALLTGTYSMIRGSALWTVSWGASIQNWTYGSAASDDAYKGSEITDQVPVNDIERWEVTPTNGYPADKWRLCLGMGVDRANKTIKVINKTLEDGKITQEQATKYLAEVKFLRALFNFEARLVFGDYIPILTEETAYPKMVSNVNAEGAVLKHITDDLKYAADNLPETQAEVGRPTKYAAMALAARAYLQDLKYTEAKPLLDAIIASGKYSLMDKFIQNFEIETNNNKESIFEIQANVNDIDESLNAEMGIGLNWPHGGDIGMCCGFHQPSQNLVNAYKVDANGLPLFDTFNNTDFKNDAGISSDKTFVPDDVTPVDPRLDFTVSRRGIPYKDWGVNRGSAWIRKQSEGGPYLPAPKPFFKESERYSLSTTTGWQTGINANNYRYIRYSHILLWRAEVAAFEGDVAMAKDLVNQIRTRAANDKVMGKVKVYELPTSFFPWGKPGDVDFTQPAANYKIGNYSSFASKDEAMKAVQWEQRLEFATEGMRFFDLRRWDNLPGKIGGKSMAEILNGFATADLRIRAFMNGASFSEGDKYQPIPQVQLDLQKGVLEQRPEYK